VETKAVSTWSLHRVLGSFFADDPVDVSKADRKASASGPVDTGASDPDRLPLLDLPAELHDRGYDRVQICHFHLPTRAPSYLAELKAALAEADVELDAVLVDDGDLTHPTDADTHEAWIDGWLDDATALGAKRARVIAGRSAPTAETVAASSRRLAGLAGRHPELRVVTENWLEMTPSATEVLSILGDTGDSVGLLIDLGNWTGADKYEQLERIAPLAETCHAKCHFGADGADADDFRQSLGVLKAAGFDGPLALIYDGKDAAEWDSLELEQKIVSTVFS
jgi:sugar phosphate isomerase/epimerase